MTSLLHSAMPPSLSSLFGAQDSNSFIIAIVSEFNNGQGPKWFSSMSPDVQTWFTTRYMLLVNDALDWGSTALSMYIVLTSITGTDGLVVTVRGSVYYE